jgi:hypothetical protein
MKTKMTSSASCMKRIAAAGTIVGLASVGIAAVPKPAAAWWNHYGWGVGVYVPPVVVAASPAYYAPPSAYYAPPAYHAPPARPWIPAHWENGYWVRGHWG